MNFNRKSKIKLLNKDINITSIDPLDFHSSEQSTIFRTLIDSHLRSEITYQPTFLQTLIQKAAISLSKDEKINIGSSVYFKECIQKFAAQTLQLLLKNPQKQTEYQKELMENEQINEVDADKVILDIQGFQENEGQHNQVHCLASFEWQKLVQISLECLLQEIYPLLYIEEQKQQLNDVEKILIDDLSSTQSPLLQKKLHKAIKTSQTLIKKASKEALSHFDLLKNTDFLKACLSLHDEVSQIPIKHIEELHEEFATMEQKINHLLEILQRSHLKDSPKQLSGLEKIKGLIKGFFRTGQAPVQEEQENHEGFETLLDHHADDIHNYWADLKALKKQCLQHGLDGENLCLKVKQLKNKFNEVVRLANFRKHHFILSGDIEHLIKNVQQQINANRNFEMQFQGFFVQKIIQAIRNAEQFKKQQLILNHDEDEQKKIIEKIDSEIQTLNETLETLLCSITEYMLKEKNESFAQFYAALNANELKNDAAYQETLRNEIKSLKHLEGQIADLTNLLNKLFPYKSPSLIETTLIDIREIKKDIEELLGSQATYAKESPFLYGEHLHWRNSKKPLTSDYHSLFSKEQPGKQPMFTWNNAEDSRKVFLNLFFFQFKNSHSTIDKNLRAMRFKSC